MLSIKNNVVNEISIKKSKFITYLFRVDSVIDVNNCLSNLSVTHSDSTHICYAYVIDNVKRFSDNGEPGGTAGMPILNVLESNSLNHILCCVVRYFGGIKLGANGLVRAYSSSTSLAVSSSIIVDLILGKLCSLEFNYDDTKMVDSLLKSSIITNKKYDDRVCYNFKISANDFLILKSDLSKFGNLNIIDDCYIEKDL